MPIYIDPKSNNTIDVPEGRENEATAYGLVPQDKYLERQKELDEGEVLINPKTGEEKVYKRGDAAERQKLVTQGFLPKATVEARKSFLKQSGEAMSTADKIGAATGIVGKNVLGGVAEPLVSKVVDTTQSDYNKLREEAFRESNPNTTTGLELAGQVASPLNIIPGSGLVKAGGAVAKGAGALAGKAGIKAATPITQGITKGLTNVTEGLTAAAGMGAASGLSKEAALQVDEGEVDAKALGSATAGGAGKAVGSALGANIPESFDRAGKGDLVGFGLAAADPLLTLAGAGSAGLNTKRVATLKKTSPEYAKALENLSKDTKQSQSLKESSGGTFTPSELSDMKKTADSAVEQRSAYEKGLGESFAKNLDEYSSNLSSDISNLTSQKSGALDVSGTVLSSRELREQGITPERFYPEIDKVEDPETKEYLKKMLDNFFSKPSVSINETIDFRNKLYEKGVNVGPEAKAVGAPKIVRSDVLTEQAQKDMLGDLHKEFRVKNYENTEVVKDLEKFFQEPRSPQEVLSYLDRIKREAQSGYSIDPGSKEALARNEASRIVTDFFRNAGKYNLEGYTGLKENIGQLSKAYTKRDLIEGAVGKGEKLSSAANMPIIDKEKLVGDLRKAGATDEQLAGLDAEISKLNQIKQLTASEQQDVAPKLKSFKMALNNADKLKLTDRLSTDKQKVFSKWLMSLPQEQQEGLISYFSRQDAEFDKAFSNLSSAGNNPISNAKSIIGVTSRMSNYFSGEYPNLMKQLTLFEKENAPSSYTPRRSVQTGIQSEAVGDTTTEEKAGRKNIGLQRKYEQEIEAAKKRRESAKSKTK